MQPIKNSLHQGRRTISNLLEIAFLIPLVLFILLQNYLQMKYGKKGKATDQQNNIAEPICDVSQTLWQSLLETHAFTKGLNTKFMQDLTARGKARHFDYWGVQIDNRRNVLINHAREFIANSWREHNLQPTIATVQQLLNALDAKQKCIQLIQQKKLIRDELIVRHIQRAHLRASRRDERLKRSLYLYEGKLDQQWRANDLQEKQLYANARINLTQVKTAIQSHVKPAI